MSNAPILTADQLTAIADAVAGRRDAVISLTAEQVAQIVALSRRAD